MKKLVEGKMKFVYQREMNYYETDKMGVIHHSNYIRFLEEARCKWLEEMNLSMEKLEQMGYTIPTLEVNCQYKSHVTSGDIILIEPSVTAFNGVRMTVTYKVTDSKEGKTIVEAWTKHCFTNKELKPINMKKANQEIYQLFEEILVKEDNR